MESYTRINRDKLHEHEFASGPLRTADERLAMIKDQVALQATTPEEQRNDVDTTLKQLVEDTCSGYLGGKLSKEAAGSMLMIAIEEIDNYKDDGDPTTNGEKIATALALVPPELLEGPLRQFAEAEGNDELAMIVGEISQNDPKYLVEI